ncbi:unnamed protein product [Caenorhabditis nigoni]
MTGREFTLKYELKDVGKLRDWQIVHSPEEEHSGIQWKIWMERREDHLAMYLCTNVIENQKIYADYTMKVISKNKGKTHSISLNHIFENRVSNWGRHKFIEWKTMKNEYMNDGKLEIQIPVKINRMVGFAIEGLRSFGEDVKQFSDVILVAEGRKFYVSKLYLSYHSSYFTTLFSGAFQESGKTEIKLKGLNPDDLQYFLEFLHGEGEIDEYTVQGILMIADMYATPLAIKKCENYLIEKSKIGLKKKFALAGKYRLEELKKECMNQIKSKEDIRSVVPSDPSEMDPKILAELFKKSIAFN